MCKYCEKNKTIKEKFFDITIVNSCLVVGNECSEGCGYDRTRFNINYCPMCRKEAGRVNKEEIVQILKFVADEIDKDIKIFEETHNFEHIYDYNVYSIKEFIDEFINIMNTMKEDKQ